MPTYFNIDESMSIFTAFLLQLNSIQFIALKSKNIETVNFAWLKTLSYSRIFVILQAVLMFDIVKKLVCLFIF